VKFGRHHVLPKRFAIVEAGQLYRSGYLETWPLQRVIRNHELKTVLALMNNEPDTARQQKEEAITEREGVSLIRIGMPGDGCADFDLLDRAADIIADESVRPLLVHCSAGVHRTGAAYAAWRMKYCGWSPERALAEMEEYGYNSRARPKLREHMQKYFETRVVSTSQATN
ncbi:MAG: dual specificity protein phosphatase family protein, partial [Planctomycetota bacterium]